MEQSSNDRPRTRPIASAILPDGAHVEMIHRPAQRETAFLRWQAGAIDELSSIDVPGLGRLVPYSPDNNLITHGVVLFPSDAVEYESAQTLIESVEAFIHTYADLSETFEEIAAHYVLLTWTYDAFSELCYLRLLGDYGTGKSRVLQVIGSICYKPMFVSGASTVSPMFRIIDAFRGTLVIDESDFRFSDERAEIVKILNNGNASGFPILRSEITPTKEYNPRAFAVYGPKLIATRRRFDDPALESRCITEVMSGLPPRHDIPLSLPPDFHTKAQALRNQLVMYRFRNLEAKRDVEVRRLEGLESRIAQVYAPLLSVAKNADVRARMLQAARGQTSSLQAERSASLEAELLTVLSAMRTLGRKLVIGEVAAEFASHFGPDHERPITARWIGGQLRRRLSLVPIKSDGVFVIPETEYGKLDRLIERYGLKGEAVDVGTSETS
jgi:hypothetical protein